MTEVEHLIAKIDAFLAENPDLSDRALSMRATSNVDTIRNIRRSHLLPKERNLSGLASFMGTTVDALLGRANVPTPGDVNSLYPRIEVVSANMGDVRRAFRAMPGGLPVYGTALGHNIQFDEDGGAEIEVTLYEPSNAILYVARPPALMDVKEAYGFYVQGDSMAPAHKDGVLRFANPRAPIRVTDDVVVQLRAPIDDGQDGEEVISVLIKTLIKRTASYITLEQLNPHCRFNVPADRVAAIHRVMEMDDLFRRG